MKQHARIYKTDSKAYCLRGVVASSDVIRLVTILVHAGAFHKNRKYHEIVKCDPQAMSLHNDFVELQDFIPQHIIQLADTHVSSKWALSSLATSELEM